MSMGFRNGVWEKLYKRRKKWGVSERARAAEKGAYKKLYVSGNNGC